MNKEKLKGYANLLEATSRDTAEMVSEYVSEQSLVWQKLAQEMFKLWNEDGGKFLFSQKMLLPVSATKNSGYSNLKTKRQISSLRVSYSYRSNPVSGSPRDYARDDEK